MSKALNIPPFSPNRRIIMAIALSGLMIVLFIVALYGFLSAWKDMQEVVRDNQASRLASEVNANFQLAVSKGKNFTILKDELNKDRALEYFKKAKGQFDRLSDLEKDTRGKELIFELGAALKSVDFSIGILTTEAKKSDPAEELYRRYLKDITIDFDNSSQVYVDYLDQKIQRAQSDLSSQVRTNLWVAFFGVLMALGVMGLSLSVIEKLRRALMNEAALQERDERLDLFDGLTEEAIMIHDQGVIVEVNRALTHLLGYDRSEIIGRNVSNFMSPRSVEETKSRIEKGYPDDSYEINAKRKNGTTFPLLVHGRDFLYQGRKLRASSGWDITERKVTEEALRQSEENFRNLIESAPDAVLVHQDGKISYVNNKCLQLLGYNNKEDILTKAPLETIHPDDREKIMKRIERTLQGGENPAVEIRVLKKDDVSVEVESSSIGIRFQGDPATMVIFRDITERRRVQAELQQREKYYRALIENIQDVITVLDFKGNHLFLSPFVQKVTGYAPEEILGKGFEGFIHPEDLSAVQTAFQAIIQNPGEVNRVKYRFRHKNGDWIICESVGKTFRSTDQECVIVANRDVTEQERAGDVLRQKELYFRSLIENSHDVISITGSDGLMTYISPSVKRILGYDPAERIGKGYVHIMHPDDLERIKGEFAKLRGVPGSSWTVEFRLRHKDGSWRNVESTGINLLEDPAVGGIVYNLHDVTDKKRVEDALRQSEENFRNLIEKSPDAIIVHTLEKTVYVNEAMLGLLGYEKAGELVGQKPEIIVHSEDRKSVRARIQKLNSGGGYNPPLERRFLTKDGRVIPVEVVSFTLQFQGEPMVVAVARDLTERKESEKALMKFERLSTIGEMAASLAHEIRNPLASISAAAQLMKRKPSKQDTGQEKYLKTILDQTARLNQLILDTLHFSRAEKPAGTESFSLKEALESALRLSQVQFGPSHSKVRVEWKTPKEDFSLKANPQRIQQVLVNLILNAYQAMPEGGTLSIGFDPVPPWATIRIEDSGPGIPEEAISRIFEPFFTTKNSGSGLGLAICQRIAAEHGGKLEAERLKPHGTVFTLRLPLSGGDTK